MALSCCLKHKTNLKFKTKYTMERDELFEEAARLIVENKMASASFLQIKLILGYNRAGRIIDQLETYGVISEFNGIKSRQILFDDLASLNEFLEKIK